MNTCGERYRLLTLTLSAHPHTWFTFPVPGTMLWTSLKVKVVGKREATLRFRGGCQRHTEEGSSLTIQSNTTVDGWVDKRRKGIIGTQTIMQSIQAK
jgi:hypothetical protein